MNPHRAPSDQGVIGSTGRLNQPPPVGGEGLQAQRVAIRAHYRDRVKQYHPDRVQHLGPEFQTMAEQKLKDINEAYAYFKSKKPDQ